MSATTLPAMLASRLREITGADHVLTDPELTASYSSDWTRRFVGRASAVVRPGNADEVAAVLRECEAAGIAVVPQGGNTSLVGGATPMAGELVLSLGRLADIDYDPANPGLVTVGAGVTAARLNEAVRPHGVKLGVALASRDSATIGGMVATNAGGIHVLRYGPMRAQVAGLEAVLPGGAAVSRLAFAGKDNTGYDLPNLLAGSEGTLAVITRVRLRLVPDWTRRAVALVATGSLTDAVSLTHAMQAALPDLEAAELFLQDGLDLVCAHTGAAPPFANPAVAYVVFECAGPTANGETLAAALIDRPEVRDAVLAEDPRDRARLWAYRERHTEAISAAGIPHKLDVAVPPEALATFGERAPEVVRAVDSAARVVLFGHVAEGNLHVNVLGLEPEDERVDEAVLRLVASLGGSISAEHGIGIAKKRWLHLTRSAADIAAMRAIKSALDPRGTLNPGVLFEPTS